MNGAQPFSFRLLGLSNAGTAAKLDCPAVYPGEFWDVGFMAVYNNSGESISYYVAILSGGNEILLTSGTGFATATAANVAGGPLLFEGDVLRLSVTGTANKAAVWFVATGYRRQNPPSATPVPPLASQEAAEV